MLGSFQSIESTTDVSPLLRPARQGGSVRASDASHRNRLGDVPTAVVQAAPQRAEFPWSVESRNRVVVDVQSPCVLVVSWTSVRVGLALYQLHGVERWIRQRLQSRSWVCQTLYQLLQRRRRSRQSPSHRGPRGPSRQHVPKKSLHVILAPRCVGVSAVTIQPLASSTLLSELQL